MEVGNTWKSGYLCDSYTNRQPILIDKILDNNSQRDTKNVTTLVSVTYRLVLLATKKVPLALVRVAKRVSVGVSTAVMVKGRLVSGL